MADDQKQEILRFYEKLLKSLNASVDSRGLVSIRGADGKMVPLTVEERRLVLPTTDILRSSDWDNVQAFHPICEGTMLGESIVIKRLRFLVTYRLNEIATVIAAELMRIAATRTLHSRLPPTASEFLVQMAEADEKTLNIFYKVLAKSSPTSKDPMINIFMKRSAKLGEFSFTRGAIVNFPMLDLINDEVGDETQYKVARGNIAAGEITLLGEKMRKTDREAIVNLIRWMFPDYSDISKYSVGSSAMTAPFFQALIRAYVKMVNHMLGLIKDFKSLISTDFDEELTVDLSWVPYIDNLDQFRDHIPTLPGNEGERRHDQKDMPTEIRQQQHPDEQHTFRNQLKRDPEAFREPARASARNEPAGGEQRPKYGEYNKMPATNAVAQQEDDWETFLIRRDMQQSRMPPQNTGRGYDNYGGRGGYDPRDPRGGYPPQNTPRYSPDGRPVHHDNRFNDGYHDRRYYHASHYNHGAAPPYDPYGYSSGGRQPTNNDPYGGNMPRFRGAGQTQRR